METRTDPAFTVRILQLEKSPVLDFPVPPDILILLLRASSETWNLLDNEYGIRLVYDYNADFRPRGVFHLDGRFHGEGTRIPTIGRYAKNSWVRLFRSIWCRHPHFLLLYDRLVFLLACQLLNPSTIGKRRFCYAYLRVYLHGLRQGL